MMPGGASTPLAQLLASFGREVIETDPAMLDGVAVDHHLRHRGKPLALALPRDTAEVSRLLALCNTLRISVVPQGGNTGYCAAATPDASGTQLVLSLRRMNAIRRVDRDDGAMIVEAGCILAEVQKAASEVGRFFPLSLGAEGSCQIGGNLSTNAGGLNVLRYGMTRDLVLGLEVVLADGRVWSNLSPLRKDNTGYDLRHLFLGAEGTLGVITAASLKLFPAQRGSATALVAVPTPAAAVQLLARLRERLGDLVNSFELIPQVAMQLLAKHLPSARQPLAATAPWYVLCEATSADASDPLADKLGAEIEAAIEAGLVDDAVLAQNERERLELWQLRENVPEAQRREGASLKHDVSLPIGRLAEFIDIASRWLGEHVPEAVLVCYGHVGDGNLHFNLSAQPGDTSLASRGAEIRRVIHDLVAERGGSFSAEHGIGQTKVDELARYAPAVELEIMHGIKHLLDPNGIMNPGKVLRAGRTP